MKLAMTAAERVSRRAQWRFFAGLSASAFVLNWLWEMAQMPAYVQMAGRSWRETLPICSVAAVGDVAVTLAIYGVVALASGRLGWGVTGRWNTFAAAAVFGAVSAGAIEWYARAMSLWSYSARMPMLPLNLGLWPTLQLALLVPLSVAVARLFSTNTGRRT